MTDTCTITRVDATSPGAYNATADTHADAAPTVVYSGPCRLLTRDPGVGNTVEVGADQSTTGRVGLALPAGTTGVRTEDAVVMDSSEFAPDVVGARLRVVTVPRASQASALRLSCEEATTP